MPDPPSDFETLIGPDRRRLKRPRGLAALVTVIAGLVLIGLVVLWPVDRPDIDLGEIGFAVGVARSTSCSTVTPSARRGCSTSR
jgi:hypothetical protein